MEFLFCSNGVEISETEKAAIDNAIAYLKTECTTPLLQHVVSFPISDV